MYKLRMGQRVRITQHIGWLVEENNVCILRSLTATWSEDARNDEFRVDVIHGAIMESRMRKRSKENNGIPFTFANRHAIVPLAQCPFGKEK